MQCFQGRLLKGIGGFYYVETTDGIYECKARGVFRKNSVTPLVGDMLTISVDEQGQGRVDEILPRKNSIVRPPLANLDQLLFIVSTCEPAPNYLVLDQLIAVAEYEHIEPIVVVTKSDLSTADELVRLYQGAGITALSAGLDESADAVRVMLAGKLSALIGNSGAGKSTLINRILPELSQKTGAISQKLGRGKHTTREVSLFPLEGGGYVADTPGFSTVDLERYDAIRKEELQYCFREMEQYICRCRFTGCSHTVEKGCAVLDALREGKIAPSRHESYIAMYTQASKIKDWER